MSTVSNHKKAFNKILARFVSQSKQIEEPFKCISKEIEDEWLKYNKKRLFSDNESHLFKNLRMRLEV